MTARTPRGVICHLGEENAVTAIETPPLTIQPHGWWQLPRRLSLAGEGFTHMIDCLLPNARTDFLEVDTRDELAPLLDSLYRRDEAAAALVDAIHRTRGTARSQFEQALEHGIETVADPLPEVVAFFKTVDEIPPSLDADLVAEGIEAIRRVDVLTYAFAVAVLDGLGAVFDPNVALALLANARTFTNPSERFVGTASYGGEIFRYGYGRFAPATKTASRLRVMHESIGLKLTKKGDWDAAEYGLPISQYDIVMASYILVPCVALAAQFYGYRFSLREWDGLVALTFMLGYRHGAPAAMLPRTKDEMERGLYMLLRSNNTLSAIEATKKVLDAAINGDYQGVPRPILAIARGLLISYSRDLLGDPLCEAGGIPNSPVRYFLKPMLAAIRVENLLWQYIPVVRPIVRAAHRAAYDRMFNALDRITPPSADRYPPSAAGA